MKAEVIKNINPDFIPFPKLMISELGKIVLFINLHKGMVVANGDDEDEIGLYTDRWAIDVFKDFHGSVTLSNK